MTLRKVEVFTAGCSLCDEAVQLVQSLACPSCAVGVLDMNDDAVHAKAKRVWGCSSSQKLNLQPTDNLRPPR